jgi:hypothetical protein
LRSISDIHSLCRLAINSPRIRYGTATPKSRKDPETDHFDRQRNLSKQSSIQGFQASNASQSIYHIHFNQYKRAKAKAKAKGNLQRSAQHAISRVLE